MGNIRIGISGWRYEPWRGVFYPPKLPHRRELEFASRTFNSIESTADPRGLIDEGGGNRERNNTAVTYFTVSGGQIGNVRNSP